MTASAECGLCEPGGKCIEEECMACCGCCRVLVEDTCASIYGIGAPPREGCNGDVCGWWPCECEEP